MVAASVATTAPPEDDLLRQQLEAGKKLASAPEGEEIVITGLSGTYPDSRDVNHFRDNLFAKEELVNDRNKRWKLKIPILPDSFGNVPDATKFDAPFFGMHKQQADVADPSLRLLLEKTVECLLDAGVNPTDLRGTNTGVFLGVCISETEYESFYLHSTDGGYSVTTTSRAMLANRLSYYLGLSAGPAFVVDSACSSSLYALDVAYKSIRDGQCDAALVGCSNFCLNPSVSHSFALLGVLSPNGMCKPFDEDANGYARSEATAMIYLQKSKDAKRVYATLVHSKANCDGYKDEGITFPSSQLQGRLMAEVFQECGADPLQLTFMEAHGTGTKAGDPEELKGIDQVFCKGRKTPLPIGSVKSNIGHSEPSSGLCSLTKVIIAMETGYIPPNIHFDKPRQCVDAIMSGRMKVITEKTPWTPGYVGINSFGFGGANCHVLVKPNPKRKVIGDSQRDTLPLLVAVSGRTEQAVNVILDELANQRPVDVEFARLLHDAFAKPIPGHNHRGFVVLRNNVVHSRDVQHYHDSKRPVWFVFPGFGCQWPAMARDLLQVPVFAASIQRCHEVLRPVGLDLKHILTNKDNSVFEDVVNLSVGIVAAQIGLVDVLTTVGISPDKIVGYSIGELSCAYADGCFDTEQTMLAAYWRGVACKEFASTKGAMATVGLPAEQVRKIVPDVVDIACNDSEDKCTISGPSKDVQKAIVALKARGVITKDVDCAGVACHSRYVTDAGKQLIKYLEKIIPRPKTRSERWLSTSVQENERSTLIGQSSSAQYHAHNLFSPVLLQAAIQRIPNNAVIIEISPRSVLSDALMSVMRSRIHTHVHLSDPQEAEGAGFLLSTLGRLFQLGLELQINKLYPEVPFPVSRGTPMISPLIKWDHSKDWHLMSLEHETYNTQKSIAIDMSDVHNSYLKGHTIDGRNLFPATGYLFLVWETFCAMCGAVLDDTAVVFEDIRFMRATNLPKDGTVTFTIIVQRASGNFEVVENSTAIVTGRIYQALNPDEDIAQIPPRQPSTDNALLDLKTKDIYKELRLRGYNYSGLFRGIVSADNKGCYGKLKWVENWVAFMDNMLQIEILHADTRALYVPTALARVVIDPVKHARLIEQMGPGKDGEAPELPILVCPEAKIIQAGGVEMRGLLASAIPRRKHLADPVLERYQFVPHFSPITPAPTLQTVLRICIHILLESHSTLKVEAAEIADNPVTSENAVLAPHVVAALGDLPLVQPNINLYTQAGPHTEDLGPNVTVQEGALEVTGEDVIFVVASNIINNPEKLLRVTKYLANGGCLFAREHPSTDVEKSQTANLTVVFSQIVDHERIVLLRKVIVPATEKVIQVTEKNFSWLPDLQAAMANKDIGRALVVAQNEPMNGIIGMVNCIAREPGGKKARCVFILDPKAPPFDPNHPFYKTHLARDLAVNVYRDGQWGSYRHLPLEEPPSVLVPHRISNVTTPGDLSSYKWLEGPVVPGRCDQATIENLVQVYYSALNFRDVMTATGKLQPEVVDKDRRNLGCVQGFEYSGRTAKGKRVMGVLTYGALANMLVADPKFTWEIPDHWSLEDAATIPAVYGTAYYALQTMGQMRSGESVLIHSGTGGVGQAAINICLHKGLTVFTTVGTQEKIDFIKEHFPQVPDNHIFNSRDITFEERILEETNGKGVDLVLNSLAEEKLLASVRCLAKGGRFMEIGKFDLANNNPLGMQCFLNECSYQGVMLDNLLNGAMKDGKFLHDLLMNGIRSGAVKPLPRTVFKDDEIEKAFRYMAAGKHIGKVLVQMHPEEPKKMVVPVPRLLPAAPRIFCDPRSSYIIIGGLGGFGLELADWLVLRGAKKIVLTSRKGVVTGYQSFRIRIWESYGTRVEISTDDVTSRDGVENLLKRSNALGPVGGIFNLAVVLQDAVFSNQTEEKFAISSGPKAVATQFLDEATRRLCPNLQYFVVFSSISCGRGNAGQSNYGMSNSVMERICERRRSEGLPGLAIQWGAVGEVGLVAEMQEEHHEIEIGGTLQQTIASCLSVMDCFLRQPNPIVGSMVVAEKRTRGGMAGTIVDCVANIIGIRNMKTVNLHATLAEIGMDSMMGVEIVQTLEREFEVFLTPQDIRVMTFARLHEIQDASSTGDADAATVAPTGETQREHMMNLLLRVAGEETASKDPVIALPSKAHHPTVFMVPGLEGMAGVFQRLASNMSAGVFSLQIPVTEHYRTLQKLAQDMSPHVKATSKDEPFLLLGYSFGGILALEIAMALESQGRKGRLVLVDSSPDSIKMATTVFAQGSDDMMEVNLLVSMLRAICPDEYLSVKDTLLPKLPTLSTWKERLDHVFDVTHSRVYSDTYSKELITSAYLRLKATTAYQWNHDKCLECPVLLIRPTTMMMDIGSEDFGLKKICKNLEISTELDGDHVTILDNPETAAAITKFLLK